MRRVLGVKKDTEPPPSVQDAFDRARKEESEKKLQDDDDGNEMGKAREVIRDSFISGAGWRPYISGAGWRSW
ncbi:hypothetical protein SASPL_108360 [Salvia splendens]|uniref:Uncharacterized protein n=1 Tax=Salvia splendens TaxID=180675 RepID=A0A8X8YCY3_SALSN|nr:hypothetical protein SASPL_108360 [Salvia splendens]